MTQQTRTDDQPTGEKTDAGASIHGANKRVEQLRGNLQKAVTGREHVIKTQALKWAEQLDARWQGRHHNKIHLALRAVELIVDNVSANRAKGQDATGSGPTSGTSSRAGAGRADGSEHLGEFRNLNDEPRA